MRSLKSFQMLFYSVGILCLAGCTAFSSYSEVDALNDAEPVGSPFAQALAEEYRLFANTELKDMFDYPDALHFARKGLAAAAGDMVMPEPVSDWSLDDLSLSELADARARLIRAYDLGGREIVPDLAARAQGKYDCWIERAEENPSPSIITCKDQFLEAMNELESKVEPPPVPEDDVVYVEEPVVVPPEEFEVDASEPLAIENAMYLIFFNWDSATVDEAAYNVIDAIIREAKNTGAATVNVIGYTDTSGDSAYNKKLALKRANAVKKALVNSSMSADMIALDALGEEELLVPTADDIREPANRRVSVTFE